jgi:uncharacterized membrane protein
MSDAAGARPPRRRWLIIALAVSLVVNVFLIGGIAGTITLIHAHYGPPGPLERVAAGLDLTAPQETAFRQFQTTLRDRGRAMHRAERKIWRTLADPATGTDKVAALVQDGATNKAGFEKDTSAAFSRFLTSLTPAQRAEFISRLEALRRYRGPFHLFKRPFR